jgi:hypothetical protein
LVNGLLTFYVHHRSMTERRSVRRRRGGRKRWLVLMWAGYVTAAFAVMLVMIIVVTDMADERGSATKIFTRIGCGFRLFADCGD